MGSKVSDMIEPTHTYTHILLIQEKSEVREVVTAQERARQNMRRTSLVVQWTGIHLSVQGTWFNAWSGKIQRATEQLSSCPTTTEPVP